MRKTLRQRLTEGKVLLCDGAMGTMLQAAGLEAGEVPELWNLRCPERVLAVHLAYVAAGVDIVTTNTFGGTRIKMARAGVADEVGEANRQGAQLAREAAAGNVFVAGSLGPTGELLEPFGTLSPAEAADAYAEQAAALVKGGVDLFLIETMSDLAEATAAVMGVRRVSNLPVFCTLSFDTGGRTMMGVSPKQAAEMLAELAVEAFGANCGLGPDEMEGVAREFLIAKPGAAIICQPNAGVPSLEEGRSVYSASPETMAEYARRYAALGVRVVGSCCGSTPAHTEMIGWALEGYR
ncbi:MAG: homocysteine S-methyltransferase family protein [Chloroflexi bacterium]|nr:homocysteine S-methyltransferase family protein [Chloroflexota bacterium]MCL5107516.1 homocysteine S-methyltransferase family protein [Chloroflexota bacterium]